MRLSDLFNEETIWLDVPPGSKEEVLRAMMDRVDSRGLLADREQAWKDVLEREKVMSTGIGKAVAIPHAYTDGVDRLVAAFFRTSEGVDFDALDGDPVDLFILILGPKASRRDHIKVLAKISRLLNHEEFRDALREASSPEEVLSVFKRFGDK